MTPNESELMSNNLPDGFFGWVVGAVAAIVTALAGTVTALWKINESKNAAAIAEQSKQIVHIEGELKLVRDHSIACDEARIVCERDRAVLGTKCAIFEKRLTQLEEKTA